MKKFLTCGIDPQEVYLASDVDAREAQHIAIDRAQKAKIAELEKALRELYDADRGFLGEDNQCVYCEQAQHVHGHAETCIIARVQKLLGL